jgi:EAL and modified HD-GYP domain-containing signal transduction protein
VTLDRGPGRPAATRVADVAGAAPGTGGAGADTGVARQGIYDRAGKIVGYELLFRLPPADQAPALATEAEHERATAEVIRAVLEREPLGGPHGPLLFVNVPRAFVVGDLPLSLPPDRVVVEVLEHVVPDDELLAGVRALTGRGYRVAVDDWDGDRDRHGLIAEADYVKIDMHQVPADRLDEYVRDVRATRPGARVVIERVECADDHDRALGAGADLFQGYHLQAPEYLAVG